MSFQWNCSVFRTVLPGIRTLRAQKKRASTDVEALFQPLKSEVSFNIVFFQLAVKHGFGKAQVFHGLGPVAPVLLQ